MHYDTRIVQVADKIDSVLSSIKEFTDLLETVNIEIERLQSVNIDSDVDMATKTRADALVDEWNNFCNYQLQGKLYVLSTKCSYLKQLESKLGSELASIRPGTGEISC